MVSSLGLDDPMVHRDALHDIDLSIRFKHGIHTILLFVDPMKPFSEIAEELLETMQERYPAGLKTSKSSPTKTALPESPLQIEFAVPKSPADLSQGWALLDLEDGDTPTTMGLKDNGIIAFAFKPIDADEDYEIIFKVDYPRFEDDDEDDE
ncbi:hypothetical protein GGR53DRAFT_462672 [Hypoxylon sp. FL1150]|nr:hypothetical protein GGR53DRAFT_462672 [Hypoxylon sp. FL1150]